MPAHPMCSKSPVAELRSGSSVARPKPWVACGAIFIARVVVAIMLALPLVAAVVIAVPMIASLAIYRWARVHAHFSGDRAAMERADQDIW